MVFRDFGCGGVSKPMLVMMAVSTDLTDFYVVFTRQNSIFNLPSASSEFRDTAREFLKSKCPLSFEAFSADDKLLIGNGHGEAEE